VTCSTLLLPGIDGANPLGFLAALGVLRTLFRAEDALRPRLAWQVHSGAWRPALTTEIALSRPELVARLDEALRSMVDHEAWRFSDNLNVEAGDFRSHALAAAARASTADPTAAEFVAAFACDAITEVDAKKGVVVCDTAFRTMSGAGHQHFLGFMRQLAACTEQDHLERALFEQWRYEDDKPSMRWDPIDDRRYALRWNEPSSDPIRTVRGANRLAIEALPLFPVMPRGTRLETTGFVTAGSRGTWFRWPIWSRPISMPVVQSLLASQRVRQASTNEAALRRMGVEAVFKSQRLTVEKYRNFTMGVPA